MATRQSRALSSARGNNAFLGFDLLGRIKRLWTKPRPVQDDGLVSFPPVPPAHLRKRVHGAEDKDSFEDIGRIISDTVFSYLKALSALNGFLTLLSDGKRLTGACALGPEAGEWMQQATLAIRAHVPLVVLSDTIQPFTELPGDLRRGIERAPHADHGQAATGQNGGRADGEPAGCAPIGGIVTSAATPSARRDCKAELMIAQYSRDTDECIVTR